MSIERNDAMIDYKDTLIEFIVQKEKATEISKKDAEDANKIVRELDIMQVIGSADVMKILDCKTTKARQVLKMMENNEISTQIKDNMKTACKFKNSLDFTGGFCNTN